MGCLCIPTTHHNRPFFHWPNFTWARSEHSIDPRRTHSTFSLSDKGTSGRRRPRRRHTLHNGTTLAHFGKPRETRHSGQTTKTAPPALPIAADAGMADQYIPPAGPPPSYHGRQSASNDDTATQQHVQWAPSGHQDRELASNVPYRNAHSHASQAPHPSEPAQPPQYEAPPGPPPSWSDKKVPLHDEEYPAPPGPPPSHGQRDVEPPPYDPWLAVPDNALLPPPPSVREERSPTANASYDDAARAHAWCREYALWPARQHDPQTLQRISMGDIRFTIPRQFQYPVAAPGMGRTLVRTASKCPDTIFISDIPLYTAYPTPSRTTRMYYEIHVVSMGGNDPAGAEEADAGIAIGFLAPPYPSWRLPGWHRASLGVHGDDGRRYVDNSYGGRDFTSAFRPGDVVGIGMTISPPESSHSQRRVQVFFTRNGKREGGWDLHEERDRDQEEGDVRGLEGGNDVHAAVGFFGEVQFEVKFKKEDWAFRE